MTRRADPERVIQAQRAGIRARLIDRMQPETADRWLDAWVLGAAGRGLRKDESYGWIVAERAVRRLGSTSARNEMLVERIRSARSV